MAKAKSRLSEIMTKHEGDLLTDWGKELRGSGVQRDDLMNEGELREQTRDFLSQLRQATESGSDDVLNGGEWSHVRELLSTITRSRVAQGFTPSQVATFVLSLKRPLFDRLRKEYANDAPGLADEVWTTTQLIDKLGLYVGDMHQKSREEVIARQQQEMLELSTPVVKLWDGILALPMIGTLDSARTQIVMESLLQKIVDTGAEIAIIDITGVPTVDTLVAQHLLKTVTAARLMGADCIISGIRPQIAQTIVHLGVDLQNVITKASLMDAFALALRRSNLTVKRVGDRAAASNTSTTTGKGA